MTNQTVLSCNNAFYSNIQVSQKLEPICLPYFLSKKLQHKKIIIAKFCKTYELPMPVKVQIQFFLNYLSWKAFLLSFVPAYF